LKLELFIDGQKIDLPKDTRGLEVAMSYSQADFKEPNKRQRSLSKNVKLPATRKNNLFFHSAYDLARIDTDLEGFGFEFNPAERYPARILRNGAVVFSGGINYEQCELKNGKPVFHNVTFYSAMTNIFQKLGDVLVSELGWDSYDHVLSVANIAASWTAGTGSSYLYPLIDFGLTNNPLKYKTNQLYPFVYVREIIEKCFTYAGFTLDSDFLTTTSFDEYCWGSGGGERVTISVADQTLRRCRYSGDGGLTRNYPPSDVIVVTYEPIPIFFYNYAFHKTDNLRDSDSITTAVTTDSLSQYDTTTGNITIANTGFYHLNVSADVLYSWAVTGGGTWNINTRAELIVYKNEAEIARHTLSYNDTGAGSTTANLTLSQDFDCDAGDNIRCAFRFGTADESGTLSWSSEPGTLSLTWDYDNTIDMDLTATNGEVVDGDTIVMASVLPRVKAQDFLKDMVIAFNLFIDEPDADQNVKVEDFDGFYYETDDVDQWTDLVDTSRTMSIKPASTIEGKTYQFRFTQDRDYYKMLYFKQYDMDYGDYDYNVPSTYKTGTKPYMLKNVAQSVPVQIEGTSNLIIPRILDYDEATGVTKAHKGKPRMFIYHGLISSDTWTLINSDTLAETDYTSYPRVHHLDDLTSPTKDFNFSKPTIVFYAASAYSNNNLFYQGYARLIRELTGRDSKIVNAFIKLNETDLYPGFLRRQANINGTLFRKNIVKDFVVNDVRTTKVELIRLVESFSDRDFNTSLPEQGLPNFGDGGGGFDDPITDDEDVYGWQSNYMVDASGGDVTISADVAHMIKGQTFSVTKVDSSPGKVTISLTDSNGILTPTIYGETSLDLELEGEVATIFYDGENFNLN